MGFSIRTAGRVHCDNCDRWEPVYVDLVAGSLGGWSIRPDQLSLPTGWGFWVDRFYRQRILCPTCYPTSTEAPVAESQPPCP